MRLNNPNHVKRMLNQVINELRENDEATALDIKKANTIGYLANIMLKAMEMGEIVERLEAIEKKLGD